MAGFIQANDLERVANMLADNYGIKVVCRGTKCQTNGKVITLPSLPPDRTNEKVLSLIRYFLDHEVGHLVGKSDLSLKAELEKTHGKGAGEILGALEDVRVERLMASEYAGCGINLADGGSLVREKQEELMATDVSTLPPDEAKEIAEKQQQLMHPVKQLLSSMYLIGRGEEPLSFVSDETKAILAPFEDEIRNIPQWAKKTADLLPLAGKLVQAYVDAAQGNMSDDDDEHGICDGGPGNGKGGRGAKGSGSGSGSGGGSRGKDSRGQPKAKDPAEPPETDEDEETDDDEEDEDQEDAGGGAGEEEEVEKEEKDEATAASSDDEPDDGSNGLDPDKPAAAEPVLVDLPESSSTNGGGGSGGSGGGVGATDTKAMFEDALDFNDVAQAISTAVSETIGEVALEDPLSMIRPVRRDIDKIKQVEPGLPDQAFIDQCKAAGGSMRQKLAQLLMSEASIAHIGGLRRGKPDSRALTRLISGNSKHVFRRRVEVPAPDTACMLLIDCSGSMRGAPIYNACMAAAAFAHVLDQCHHASMIAGFDDDDANRARVDPEDLNGPGIRASGITLWQCKGWNEPFAETMKKLYALMRTGGGGTPLAEAMHMAAAELNKRTEKRKVLVCFTDGAPGFYGGEVNMEALPQEVDGDGKLMWQESSTPVWEKNPDGTVKKDAQGREIYQKDAKGYCVYEKTNEPVRDPAAAYCRKIAMECERSGIEVVMVGIHTDAVKRLHKRYAVVNELKDLATTTMAQLTKALDAGHHR